MTRSLGIFDIGSNTVLLTAGRLRKNETASQSLKSATSDPLEVLLELHDVARLSEGLQDGGPLQTAAKIRVLEILKEFQQQAKAAGIHELKAAGTAAFRRASDGEAFAKEIETTLNIPTQILSGEQEAHYSFQSAADAFPKLQDSLGMIDIGGGSTEVVSGDTDHGLSLPIGTVRLTESLITKHPITDQEWQSVRESIQSKVSEISGACPRVSERMEKSPFLRDRRISGASSRVLQKTLQQKLATLPKKIKHWVAVAATPPALAAIILKLPTYDLKKIHGFVITQDMLSQTIEFLRGQSISERNLVPGMPPKRAELIPVGGLILLELMKHLGTPQITVSHQGLRYALLREGLMQN